MSGQRPHLTPAEAREVILTRGYRAFVECFCQEGPNKGKPGPCPGGKKGTAKAKPAAKEKAPAKKAGAPAKTLASKVGNSPADVDAHILHSVMGHLPESGGTELLRDMRKQMPPGLQGRAFDRAIMRLANEDKIILHRHDQPGFLTPKERQELVQDPESGTYFASAGFRDGQKSMPAKKPEAKPAKPAAKKAPAKAVKPTVDDTHAHIKGLLAEPHKITPDTIAATATRLQALTVPQLTELKQKFGLKASGTKAELAKKIATQALSAKPEKVAPKAKATAKKVAARKTPPEKAPESPAETKSTPEAHIPKVVDVVKATGGKSNFSSMVDVRKALTEAGVADPKQQDAAIVAAMRAGHVTSAGVESDRGQTPGEMQDLLASRVALPDGSKAGYLMLKAAPAEEQPAAVSPKPELKKPAAPAQDKPKIPAGHTLAADDAKSGLLVSKDKAGEMTTQFAPGQPERAAKALAAPLDKAFKEASLYREARDGLAPLQLVVGLAKQFAPEGTTTGDVFAALTHMGGQRQIELHGLNEINELPRMAVDGSKDRATGTLWRSGKALHFVMLPQKNAEADSADIPPIDMMAALIDAAIAKKAATHTERRLRQFSEGSTLNGVEVFATGKHRGRVYTRADLQAMVDNFRRFSMGKQPALSVPAVLGHEETQEFLERSDLPAAAWATRAYLEDSKRRGPDGKPKSQSILKVDFADVPKSVAALIKGRRYRTVSAEVYDDPPEGIPGKGKMLRRVAFLGGDIPQVKTLADIPLPEMHAEFDTPFAAVSLCPRESHALPGGAYACFSEVKTMSREEMLKQLGDLGADIGAFPDTVPDSALAEMIRLLTDGGDDEADDDIETPGDETENLGEEDEEERTADMADGEEDETEDMADEPTPPEDRKDDVAMAEYGRKMAEYCDSRDMAEGDEETEDFAQDAGQKAMWAKADATGSIGKSGKFSKKKLNARSKKMRTLGNKHFGEGDVPTATGAEPMPKKTTTTHHYSEARIANRIRATLEKEASSTLAKLKKFSEQQEADRKRATVEQFCEAHKDRILPAELDRDDPCNLFDRLLLADAKTCVRKFTEKGKEVKLTEFDLLTRSIEKRPLLRFGEKFRDPKTAKTTSDVEVEKVQRFSEQESFTRALEATGKTPTDFVEGFKAAQKKNPQLTAAAYGVPADA